MAVTYCVADHGYWAVACFVCSRVRRSHHLHIAGLLYGGRVFGCFHSAAHKKQKKFHVLQSTQNTHTYL